MVTTFRDWHHMSHNKAVWTPACCCFVDTEATRTDIDTPHPGIAYRFRLGCATMCYLRRGVVQRTESLRFHTPDQFWTWLVNAVPRQSACWLFAHNLACDFTWLDGWKYLEDGTFQLQGNEDYHYCRKGRLIKPKRQWKGCLILEDPPSIISVRAFGKTIRMVDTLNYWQLPLYQLGRSIGVEKWTYPGDQACDPDLSDYCMNDVDIIRQSVCGLIQWWRTHDLGQWRATAAGLAMSAYRHRFLPDELVIHGCREAIDLERAAYFGGQCEVFKVGPVEGPVWQYDVSSAYASVMRGHPYPAHLIDYQWEGTRERIDCLDIGLSIIARVRLRATEPFPHRDEKGRVTYPVGDYWTALAGQELWRAKESGQITGVAQVATYRSAYLFSDFVDYFYPLKEAAEREGNLAHRTFAKTILVSIYGKFGQRSPGWEEMPGERHTPAWDVWPRLDVDAKTVMELRSIAGHVQRRVPGDEGPDSAPGVCAYVTSYLRERMRELRTLAGERNVYYQDTDSLHVSASGASRLASLPDRPAGSPGRLVASDPCDGARYFGPRHYDWGDRRICAGLPGRATVTADGYYRTERWERMRSITQRCPDGTVYVWLEEGKLDQCHPNGVVGEDGWVTPYVLGPDGRQG